MSTANSVPSADRPMIVTLRAGRGLVRLLYTQNPFYAISAALVFTGLRMSFNTQGRAFDVGGLLTSLAGYTGLLAVTAWLLIRFGKVWDDVRSLLVLVVLMFLAISVTLDDVLAARLQQGEAYCFSGWLFAMIVSESLLHGLRIRLPAAFRIPYHLGLAHLFLYPVLLVPYLPQPDGPQLQWGLFGFSVTSAVILTLLIPAMRRGPAHVADNGTPWKWPLFPWTLFAVLGFGFCLRSYYMCLSLHFVGGAESIFGWYFLVPLMLAVNLLVLERAVATRSVSTRGVAMVLPVLWFGLAGLGHSQGPVYTGFIAMVEQLCSAKPLFLTALATVAFYGLAAWRGLPGAWDLLTVFLLVNSFITRQSLGWSEITGPHFLPWAIAACLQIVLGWRRENASRYVLAAVLGWKALSIALPNTMYASYQPQLLAHAALFATFWLAEVSRGELSRQLRLLGAAGLVLFCLADLFTELSFAQFPDVWGEWYPGFLILLGILAGRFTARHAASAWPVRPGESLMLRWLGLRAYYLAAVVDALAWLFDELWHNLRQLSSFSPGLKYVAWGLVCFFLAAWISLAKGGLLNRRLLARFGVEMGTGDTNRN